MRDETKYSNLAKTALATRYSSNNAAATRVEQKDDYVAVRYNISQFLFPPSLLECRFVQQVQYNNVPPRGSSCVVRSSHILMLLLMTQSKNA